MKGCVPQFEKWLQDNLTLVAGIFIGVALLQVSSVSVPSQRRGDESPMLPFSFVLFDLRPQIFGICLAQNLVSDIEAVQASW